MKQSIFHSLVTIDWILAVVLWTCWAASSNIHAAPPNEKLTLTSEQIPKNCFGDREAACSFKLTCRNAMALRVEWKVMFARRQWKQGVQRVNIVANQPTNVAFEFRSPPVAAGVIAGGTLHLRICDDQDVDHLSREFTIWVFPENPFEVEFAWLKQLNVTLIDPDKKLTSNLNALGFPSNDLAAKNSKTKVLIVSQVKSLDANFNQTIDKALRDGNRVLCLASTSGQLTLRPPNSLEDIRELPEIHAASADFVKQIDPRMNATHLVRVGQFQLRQEPNDRIALSIQNNRAGWLFLEYGFKTPPDLPLSNRISIALPKFTPQPQFVYCGLDLINSWDESPTPRYLLAELLKRMCFEPEVQPELKDQL